MIFKVSLCATGKWLAEARGVIWYNTVPILQMLLEGQAQDPDQMFASGPTPHLAISLALCPGTGTGHGGQGTKAEGGLLTLEEGGNMSKLLLTPSRVKINLLVSSQ